MQEPTPCSLANARASGGQVTMSFGAMHKADDARETVTLLHQVSLDAAAATHLRRMLALLLADHA
ncbi:MAG TPA: hypothetical protein VLJ86_21090, partial [Ramlibacter sp.]|nr:hypothetical protein [Ramlibacter sp.]